MILNGGCVRTELTLLYRLATTHRGENLLIIINILTSMPVLSIAEMKMTWDMVRQTHRLIWINVRIPRSALQREKIRNIA